MPQDHLVHYRRVVGSNRASATMGSVARIGPEPSFFLLQWKVCVREYIPCMCLEVRAGDDSTLASPRIHSYDSSNTLMLSADGLPGIGHGSWFTRRNTKITSMHGFASSS